MTADPVIEALEAWERACAALADKETTEAWDARDETGDKLEDVVRATGEKRGFENPSTYAYRRKISALESANAALVKERDGLREEIDRLSSAQAKTDGPGGAPGRGDELARFLRRLTSAPVPRKWTRPYRHNWRQVYRGDKTNLWYLTYSKADGLPNYKPFSTADVQSLLARGLIELTYPETPEPCDCYSPTPLLMEAERFEDGASSQSPQTATFKPGLNHD